MRRCCMCHKWKPESEFAFRSLATGVRQGHCRECHAAYRRQHYLKNRAAYVAREVARMKAYRLENRARIAEYFSTHPCVDCGEIDLVVLEFDHRDPATKRSEVGRLAASKRWKVVAAEIAKCDVRCDNCHRRRTARQFGWPVAAVPAPAKTRAVGRPRLEPNDPGESAVLRRCTKCHQLKPLGQFVWKDLAAGKKGARCRPCVALASREHYWRNRQPYLDKARRNQKSSRAVNRRRKAELVSGISCVDCGETDPVVLEFDHRNPDEKLGTVAQLISQVSWAKVEAEIAKCEPRCVNCHRRRTAAQFGWSRQAAQLPEDAA